MFVQGPGIFTEDLSMTIRSEYSFLLSVGKDSEEIESLLMQYFSHIFNCNDPREDLFWFALAICEWKKGRLSCRVKEKAIEAIDSGRNLALWNTPDNRKNYKKRKKTLEDLKNTLLSPMPTAKKIPKPYLQRCPYKVGSLLAYRIIANKNAKDHPLYGKYVLLRVVKIYKFSRSQLFPDTYYDESMMVGLYNWIGNEIPNPEIVNQLEYIPVADYIPLKPTRPIDFSPLDGLSEEFQKELRETVTALFSRNRVIETCAMLDWRSSKNAVGEIVCLDRDESFEHQIPAFFDTSLTSCCLTHFLPFDLTLIKRFESLLNGNYEFL